MHEYKINKNINVVCKYVRTRNGFKHEAELFLNGAWVCSSKVCYLNRTWERFEFETVLNSILEKALKMKVITQLKINKFKTSSLYR